MRPALLAFALAIGLAGCGGGGGSSAEEYRAAAERVCTRAAADAAAVPGPTDSAASVARYSAALAPIRRREADALRGLTPPDELAADHASLVSATDAIVQALVSLRAAASQESRPGAALASQQGERARARAAEAAAALGVDACGE